MEVFLAALAAIGIFIGGPALSRRAFVDGTDCRAEGVVFPLLWDSSSNAGGDAFAGRFRDRYGREADYTAAYTYDALQFLIAGIREAGLNRARIRDAVRELSPQVGVTGTIAWEPSGRNRKTVGLGTIRGGEVRDNNTLE
jgi:branched-chain amino acid transport system substrate-binding protein